jgi:hypothetical protein
MPQRGLPKQIQAAERPSKAIGAAKEGQKVAPIARFVDWVGMFRRCRQQEAHFAGPSKLGRLRRPKAFLAACVAGLALAGAAGPAVAADSLAIPITAQLRQALWPVEIGVEIIAVGPPLGTQSPTEPSSQVMPNNAVTVPDGNRVSFSRAIWTPRGRRAFAIDVVAHQHPGDEIELEWDLLVEDAPYETVSVGEYLLHRLRFGPRPGVGPEQVRVSRADIVTTRGEPHMETVEIDGQKYEIRVFVLSVRG